MAKSLKHLAGGFLLLSLHLGGVPALAQTEPTPTLTIDEQAAQLNEADRLRDKAFQLYQQEQYETALPLLQRALAIYEQVLGSDHPDIADSLNGLASIHRNMGNNSEAESLLQRALAIDEQIYEQAAQLDEADRLNDQAFQLYQQEQYETALPLLQRALAIYEQTYGSDHPSVASSLNGLASIHRNMGNNSEAESLLQRALTIDEQAAQVERLNDQAFELYQQGQSATALPLLQQALAIYEQTYGSDHPSVASSLTGLARLYSDMGNYSEVESLLQQALAIYEKTYGSDHPSVASSLTRLANLHRNMGNYSEVEPLLQRALAIYDWGGDHPNIANSLTGLARLYSDMGNYSEAKSLLQRALAIYEKTYGSDHPYVASSLTGLASVDGAMGNYSEAEPLLQRALAIYEQTYGSDHPSVASSLTGLARLYSDMGNYSEAKSLLQRALAIYEKTYGSDHPSVASSLTGLASVDGAMGNYSEVESLLQQALAIYEQTYGSDHPSFAGSLSVLARLYSDMGNYSEVESLLQRALAIDEQTYGSNHPSVASSLTGLVRLYQVQGDIALATDYLSRSLNIKENNLSLIFTTGSEAQKQAYMNTLSDETHGVISLHLQDAPNNPEAAQIAFTTLLRRKGRILDALTENIQLIRENLTPENQQLLDELTNTRTQLANLIYNKPENISQDAYETQVANLKAEANQLEAELSRRSAEFRTISQSITIAAIQQQIPADAALVELTLYRPFDAQAEPGQRWGEPRYAAYILQATGAPQWVDLGEAAPINAAAKALQNSLASYGSLDTLRDNARQLDAMLMQPIRAKLGDKTHILLSPDSQLNLIPFAALVDENNQYLVENYQITYLTTGRDLLRLENKQEPRQASVIVANPDYDEPGVNNSEIAFNRGSNRRSNDLDSIRFGALPGTAREAEAIQPLLPNATVLTQLEATEQAIKQVEAPRILHIATHGFFLNVDLVAPSANPFDNRGGVLGIRLESETSAPVDQENPLLRSGLALAGIHARSSGADEDGVLTALEVAGLNLRGTQLVVLSACETGVGDVANGEGVYGLRRALAIAGAESQLISLWKVSDRGTEELMVDYYQRLIDGEGRSDALRQVQLAMLNDAEYQHPYFWAAFIPSGEWEAME